MDKYVQILKEHGLKVTPQRLEILRYLDTHKVHPTADIIYSELKKSNPSLSKTTVYNTLQHLGEHGLVYSLTISGSELRFDSNINQHHHFLCKTCGSIIDIDIECPNAKKVEAGGHRIDEVHGYFKGVCASCLKKLKSGDD
ncbi:MAG: transcriptional repressor [Thermoplasmata archaeon]|nr:transcriptional repressor [Thermoplasmata archaeon]